MAHHSEIYHLPFYYFLRSFLLFILHSIEHHKLFVRFVNGPKMLPNALRRNFMSTNFRSSVSRINTNLIRFASALSKDCSSLNAKHVESFVRPWSLPDMYDDDPHHVKWATFGLVGISRSKPHTLSEISHITLFRCEWCVVHVWNAEFVEYRQYVVHTPSTPYDMLLLLLSLYLYPFVSLAHVCTKHTMTSKKHMLAFKWCSECEPI